MCPLTQVSRTSARSAARTTSPPQLSRENVVFLEQLSFSAALLVAAIIFPHTKWLPKITDYRGTAALTIGLAITPHSASIQLIIKHHSVLYIIVSKYSSAGKLQTTIFWKMRSCKNPFWASVGQILPYSWYWATESLECSIFHKQDALSTLVNHCNWVWKRSSYYSNHKKKLATAVSRSISLAKEVEMVFKQSPLRCFKSDSRKHGMYV